jgi:exonuclease VII large subunit
MVRSENGTVIRSKNQVKPGDPVDITFSDGELSAVVTSNKEDGYESE